jgi:hypothetical protein
MPTILTSPSAISRSTLASPGNICTNQCITQETAMVGVTESIGTTDDVSEIYYSELDWFYSNSLIKAMAVAFPDIFCLVVHIMSYNDMVIKLMISLPFQVDDAVYISVTSVKGGQKLISVYPQVKQMASSTDVSLQMV